jgi:hypothetical protein
MAEYKSWLPKKRVDVLIMARIWLEIIGINLQARGIPQEILQELTQLVMEARAALDAAPPTKRT